MRHNSPALSDDGAGSFFVVREGGTEDGVWLCGAGIVLEYPRGRRPSHAVVVIIEGLDDGKLIDQLIFRYITLRFA